MNSRTFAISSRVFTFSRSSSFFSSLIFSISCSEVWKTKRWINKSRYLERKTHQPYLGFMPEKNSRSKTRTKNKHNPHVAPGRTRTQATLVEDERSHYCAIPATLVTAHQITITTHQKEQGRFALTANFSRVFTFSLSSSFSSSIFLTSCSEIWKTKRY